MRAPVGAAAGEVAACQGVCPGSAGRGGRFGAEALALPDIAARRRRGAGPPPLEHEDDASPERLDVLIRAAARLDRQAFGVIYRVFAPRIHRFIGFQIHNRSLNRSLAEDLTNQVFLRAMEALARYDHRSLNEFNAWLYLIARNVVVDNWRTSRSTVSLDDAFVAEPAESLDSQFDQIARREELRAALAHMTNDQRDVLTFRFSLGMRHAEIANLMGRNEPAIRALQFRAIATLRGVLCEDLV